MSIEALAIVLNHSKAVGAAKIILMGIANHINPDNNGAWPSQEKLASYANITDRGVRKAVKSLVDLGELRYEVGAGQSQNQYKPNRYWLLLTCPADCDGTTNHKTRAELIDNRVELIDNRVELIDNRVELIDIQGGTRVPTNRNTTINKTNNVDATASFDAIWSIWPKRTNKAQAMKKFDAIIKTVPDLKIKAEQWLKDFPVSDPQYVPNLAAWINQKRWLDEPAKKFGTTKEENIIW